MKILAAFTLIVISLASAEPPRYRPSLVKRQNNGAAPYNPSGWRPSGPQFNPNQPSEPKPSYGPPPEPQPSYGPPPSPKPTPEETVTSTTEMVTETPTENPQAENIETNGKIKGAAKSQQPGAYFVLLPKVEVQPENLVVPLAETVVSPTLARVEVEASRKTAALVSALPAPLQVQRIVPIFSSYRNEIYTPFSSSFVQIYQ